MAKRTRQAKVDEDFQKFLREVQGKKLMKGEKVSFGKITREIAHNPKLKEIERDILEDRIMQQRKDKRRLFE